MKNTRLIFTLAAMVFSFPSISQTVMYEVTVAGRVVGSVKVILFDGGMNTVRRRIEARFSIPFYSGSFLSENDFADGFLKSSLTEHYVNGRQRERTVTLNKEAHFYRVDFSGKVAEKEKPRELNLTINHTMTNLYYEEPSNISVVYSERYGQMCSVKRLENNRYIISLPDGKHSIYAYERGRCTEVLSELAGMKLRILRK